jgi:hypothetical protein
LVYVVEPTLSTSRPKLSVELSDYLIALSVALQRHAMYPTGHPALGPAVEAVIRRAERLLTERPMLSFGIARRQLIVEGIATDPDHPVLRRLAEELHRHQLGAISVTRGIEPGELGEALRLLAGEPESEGLPSRLQGRRTEWPHISLHPLTFEGLELVGDAPSTDEQSDEATLSAELWVGLARAAISADASRAVADVPLDPSQVARSIDDHPRARGYDQVIVGYMSQIASTLRQATGEDIDVLRRRASRMVEELRPETLARIIEMGGDAGQRAAFVRDAVDGMAAVAAIGVVKAAAEAGGETIAHSMVRLLSKLALHSEQSSGPDRPLAREALRDQVGRLMSDWTLDDPNPESHRRVLQEFATAARVTRGTSRVLGDFDSVRLVQMSLESGAEGSVVERAIEECVALGKTASVLTLLDSPPAEARDTAAGMLAMLAAPANVCLLLASEPMDFASLDRLIPIMPRASHVMLLDALAASQSRSSRRRLLDRIADTPFDLSPELLERLRDERWYVARNMLVLLERRKRVPEGFALEEWTTHPDPRLRAEALRLQMVLPGARDAAVRAALDDPDARVVRVGLAALGQSCSPQLREAITRLATSPDVVEEIRTSAISALGRLWDPAAREVLLGLTDGGKTLLGRRRLAPKTPDMLAALRALAQTWAADPSAAPVLTLAAASPDADIAEAARQVRR